MAPLPHDLIAEIEPAKDGELPADAVAMATWQRGSRTLANAVELPVAEVVPTLAPGRGGMQ